MSKDKKKKEKELYLKIPYHILNIAKLRLAEKVLLAHIYSFGAKGCWQSNKTLAEMFMVRERTIRRWLNNISKHICIKNPKGYYRTIWSKKHTDVKENMDKNVHGQKVSFDPDKIDRRHGQKCPTTNNKTIKENYKRTGATPAPAHPKGAPALLVERDRETGEGFKKFLKGFGRGAKKKYQPLSEEEFEKRKQAQIKALIGEKK